MSAQIIPFPVAPRPRNDDKRGNVLRRLGARFWPECEAAEQMTRAADLMERVEQSIKERNLI